MIDQHAAEAERGYDIADLKDRGRPRLGPAAPQLIEHEPILDWHHFSDGAKPHTR